MGVVVTEALSAVCTAFNTHALDPQHTVKQFRGVRHAAPMQGHNDLPVAGESPPIRKPGPDIKAIHAEYRGRIRTGRSTLYPCHCSDSPSCLPEPNGLASYLAPTYVGRR